jgi:hypothetical protein
MDEVKRIPGYEIGRELRASDLERGMVVMAIQGRRAVTLWVAEITDFHILFLDGRLKRSVILQRVEPDRESLAEMTGVPIQVHEYLGT